MEAMATSVKFFHVVSVPMLMVRLPFGWHFLIMRVYGIFLLREFCLYSEKGTSEKAVPASAVSPASPV